MENKSANMKMNDEEKLMLFLIWCYCDQDFPLGVIKNDFDGISLLREIAYNVGFQKFLSEATQAKESFEFWVSDFDMEDIKNSVISNLPVLMNDKCEYFKNKITITIN